MNEIFNINRFWKYLVSEIKSVAGKYGIVLLVTSLSPIILYLTLGLGSVLLGRADGWYSAEWGWRLGLLFCVAIGLVISMPANCFGHITDKRAGSSWLMIPASTFEKTLGILIVGCILMPAVFMLLYFSVDAIICAIDPNCGNSLVYYWHNLKEMIRMEFLEDPDVVGSDMEASIVSFLDLFTNNWFYIEQIVYSILTFIVGALYFKKNKAVKTIGVLFVLQIAMSFAAMPFGVSLEHRILQVGNETAMAEFLENIAIWSRVWNWCLIVGLSVWIYFRLKTIKH